MSDIGGTRICVQKLIPSHQAYLKHIKNNSGDSDKLEAAFWTQKLWKKGSKINIAFLVPKKQATVDIEWTSISEMRGRPIDPLQRQFVKDKTPVRKAIVQIVQQRIQPIVDLQFKFISDPKQAQVRISFDPDGGAWSMVGTDCLHEKDSSKATMNLGWFDVGTVIHEFGHVLGMIHEHQNPRGQSIPWNTKAVYAWADTTQGWDKQTTYNNIIRKYNADSINGSSFDPQSIMLYFFPSTLTKNDCCGTKQNYRLSGLDTLWMNKIYPNSSETPAQFYPKIYGESLKKSIFVSTEEAKGGHHNNTLLIILATVLFVVIIGISLYFLIKRK